METIVTARLRLRPFRPEDAEAAYRQSREEKARRELPDEVQGSVAETRALLEGFAEACGRDPPRWPLALAVALPDGTCVGHVSLSAIPEGIEIGYAIGERFSGRGYATEAAEALTRLALDGLGLPRVLGVVRKGNGASEAVLQKCGYRFLREERREAFGGAADVWLYARDRE